MTIYGQLRIYDKKNIDISIKTKTIEREGKKYNINIREKVVTKVIVNFVQISFLIKL